MSEQMKPVDVEKIMEEIRQEIKEKGYDDSMLSFRDVDGTDQLKYNAMDQFNPGEFEHLVHQMHMRSHVEWYYQVEGSAAANFLKKVIRRFCRFMLIPIVECQNAFNASSAQSMSQVLAYVKEQEKLVKEQEKLLKEQEKAIRELSKRVEELEKTK